MFDPQVAITYASMETGVLLDLHRAFELDYARALQDHRLVAMDFCDGRMRIIRGVLGERLNATYAVRDGDRPSIICLACGRTSYNLNDVAQRYCGYCHVFHEEHHAVQHR